MEPERIIVEAIAQQRCVSASYNKGRVLLAPHILYRRHDALYIDAVTIERDGMAPRETKLGTFKIQGLTEPRLETGGFTRFSEFQSCDAKYAGATLLVVDQ